MENMTHLSQMENQFLPMRKQVLSCWNCVQAEGRAPSQRSLHVGVVLDDALYIFGGYDGTQRTNDFFKFDFLSKSWSQILPNNLAPSPRDRHSAVVYDRSIYLFGGFDGVNRVNDLFLYNFGTNTWKEVSHKGTNHPPTPRHSHAAVVYQKSMYIFSGYDGLYKNDLHRFSFESQQWYPIRDANPSAENWPKPRYRSSLTVCKDKIYMFGGHDGTRQLNDFYYFDPKVEIWGQINNRDPMPSPRDSHIALSYANSVFLFGGSTGATGSIPKNDFFEFRVDEQKWYQVQCSGDIPPSRFCHAGVTYNKKLYIFGGYDGINRLNDFYEFTFEPEPECPETTLVRDLQKLVNLVSFSDIKFIFPDGREIFGHKILLIKVPYFSALFQGGMRESRESIMKIADAKYETFLKFIGYIYTDEIEVTQFQVIVELFELADLYGVERLKIICEKKILNMIDIENAAELLSSGDRRGAHKLRDYAMNYIVKNFDSVSKTKAFENLIRYNVDLAVEILKRR